MSKLATVEQWLEYGTFSWPGPISSCALGLEPVGILVAHAQPGIPLDLLRSVLVSPP